MAARLRAAVPAAVVVCAAVWAAGSAAHSQSGKTSSHGEAEWVTVPAGWRPLGELAVGAPARSDAGVRVESRRLYGQPADGCFAVLQRASVRARGFSEDGAQTTMVRALQVAGFTAGPSAAQLPFAGRGVQGRVRSVVTPAGADRIAILSAACFYNGREPDRCRPMCDAMLDSAGTGR